jgi:hypothetical protein
LFLFQKLHHNKSCHSLPTAAGTPLRGAHAHPRYLLNGVQMQFDEIIKELKTDYKDRDIGLHIAPVYKLLWMLGFKVFPFPFSTMSQLIAIDGTSFFFMYIFISYAYDVHYYGAGSINIISSLVATPLYLLIVMVLQVRKRQQIGINSWGGYVMYLREKKTNRG